MTRTHRLLFAGTTFAVGGAERILYHLVRGLNRPPFEVELLALRAPGPIGEEIRSLGVPVHAHLTGLERVDLTLPLRLHRFLRRGKYDAIYFLDHAHAVFYTTLASSGTTVRTRVVPIHTTGQWDGQPSIKRPIRMVRRRIDRIIAIAETQRLYLIEKEGIPPAQLVVIPNGIPLELPSREERLRRRREARARVGVPDERLVIGITAVLRPEKHHELLLRAWPRVRAAVPEAELWIVGDGPRREFLETEVARLDLGSRAGGEADRTKQGALRFLGHRTDARQLMAGFDLAVLASHPRVETLPLSLLEAMDAGLPIVATRVGALPEMVEEGESGLLVPPGDSESLATALLSVLLDPELRARMGERGQQIVRQRYSVERMVAATERLLLDLLESGPKGSKV